MSNETDDRFLRGEGGEVYEIRQEYSGPPPLRRDAETRAGAKTQLTSIPSPSQPFGAHEAATKIKIHGICVEIYPPEPGQACGGLIVFTPGSPSVTVRAPQIRDGHMGYGQII